MVRAQDEWIDWRQWTAIVRTASGSDPGLISFSASTIFNQHLAFTWQQEPGRSPF